MISVSYTDTDRIRSVLGVDDKDLSDSIITDRDLEKELRLDFLSWVPTHATLYATGESTGATEAQRAVGDALTLYATYYCAVLVSKSLQLSVPQSISDGKNTMSRFAAIDWQKLDAFLKERLISYKSFVQDSNASNAVNVYNPFAGVGLSVDPVTTG